MRMLNALTLAVILLASSANAGAQTSSSASSPAMAVGPQYDTTHVYVAPEDFDRFVTSFLATFGGSTSKQGMATVTPTPSSTVLQMSSRRWARSPCSVSKRRFPIRSAVSEPAIW